MYVDITTVLPVNSPQLPYWYGDWVLKTVGLGTGGGQNRDQLKRVFWGLGMGDCVKGTGDSGLGTGDWGLGTRNWRPGTGDEGWGSES